MPFPRPTGSPTPCWKCPKCEDAKTPEDGMKADLSAKNMQAIRYYYQQKAVGGPVDAIARRNCGLIEMVIAQHNMNTQRIIAEVMPHGR